MEKASHTGFAKRIGMRYHNAREPTVSSLNFMQYEKNYDARNQTHIQYPVHVKSSEM